MEEEKRAERQRDSKRRITAIRSIAVATLAVSTCMISLPIVFTRLQEVDSHVRSELEECMASWFSSIKRLKSLGASNVKFLFVKPLSSIPILYFLP